MSREPSIKADSAASARESGICLTVGFLDFLASHNAGNRPRAFKPRFISFDCYGTLINFERGPAAKRRFADRVPAERMPAFLDSFRAYRFDEVLGDWKPFRDVIENAIWGTCKTHRMECSAADVAALHDAIPGFEPHPNVVEVLKQPAPHVPLVRLSNSMVDLIPASIAPC